MVIVGLTGSIGMGKTVAAREFERLGVPVYDADAAVHELLGPGGEAVAEVEQAFPGVVRDGAVDRKLLGERVFGDQMALERLEAILHPRVRARQLRFLKRAAARRCPVVVLDVPLLFETGGEQNCDYTVVVTAPSFVQRERVLRRPGMTEEKFVGIRARQMSEAEKVRRADFVVRTGLGRRESLRSVREIVKMLEDLPGRKWPPRGPG